MALGSGFFKRGKRGIWLACEDEHTITYSDRDVGSIGMLDLLNLAVFSTRVYYRFSGE